MTRRTAGVSVGAGEGEVEVYWARVLSLPLPEPVTGLHVCSRSGGNAAVLATTPSRIYEFVGSVGAARSKKGAGFQEAPSLVAHGNQGGLSHQSHPRQSPVAQYERLFAQYRSADGEGDAAKCLRSELPAPPAQSSVLRVFTPPSSPPPPAEPQRTEKGGSGAPLHLLPDLRGDQPQVGSTTQVAWLVQAGIYHALLTPSSNSDQVLGQASLLPFSEPSTEPPLSMALTQYHIVLLYPGSSTSSTTRGPKLVCQRVVDDAIIFTASLGNLLQPDEDVLGLSSDPLHHTVWIYTTASIFELVIQNEVRNVWRALLRRNLFPHALSLAPTQSAKEAVVAAQADRLIVRALGLATPEPTSSRPQELSTEDKRTLVQQAAELYAQVTVRPFEKIVLALSEADGLMGQGESSGGGSGGGVRA